MLLLVVACGPATPREDNAAEGDDSADTAVPTVVIEGGEAVTDAAPHLGRFPNTTKLT